MTNSQPESGEADRRYVAFISYSHLDRKVARWLHRTLESYRLPRNSQRQSANSNRIQERLAPIFLDREELPTTSDLGLAIRTALQRSDYLIVICSPAAARSRWVDEEIRSFKELGRADRILCLIVAGEPSAVQRNFSAELECFPSSLRVQNASSSPANFPTLEPLAADIRPGTDTKRDAGLKLVAGLLGTSLDEVRQRDQARRQRRLAFLSSAATLGCVVLAGLALAALRARNDAEVQRALAVQKSQTAERTAQFLTSLFQVADPSEARGNSVTAREILDQGVRQIDGSLHDEPQVRAELLTTLGRVYQGLGLYNSSSELLTKARAIPEQQPIEWIRATNSLADLEMQRGNLALSDQLLVAADKRYREGKIDDQSIAAQIILLRGGAAATSDRTSEASDLFRRALAIGQHLTLKEISVQALEGLAMSSFRAGDYGDAEKSYETALAARVALSGDTHPKAAESVNNLAATAYMRGDIQRAEINWVRLVSIERRILGPMHPELAATLNNLGRVRLERRDFKNAMVVLKEAAATYSEQQSANNVDSTFVLSNLALAHMGLREYTAAEPLLTRALAVAIANDHPLQGPITLYRADLECRTRRLAAGIRHLDEARPKIAARYPDDAWRLALLDNVRANCLTTQGHYRRASDLIAASTPVILKKWHANSMFGHQALSNAIRLFQLSGDTARLAEYQRRIQEP